MALTDNPKNEIRHSNEVRIRTYGVEINGELFDVKRLENLIEEIYDKQISMKEKGYV